MTVIQERSPTTLDQAHTPTLRGDVDQHDVRLPLELWLDILSYCTTSSLRAASITCSTLRWLAQPLLFKLFIARLEHSIKSPTDRRDMCSHATQTCLTVLGCPHIASAVTELRIIPGETCTPSRVQESSPFSNLVDVIFTILPTLVNLKTLVCHEIILTKDHLLAIRSLCQLSELELQSCRTICDPQDFPDFSMTSLETLIFDYPYSTEVFNNFRFLGLFLQSRKLTRLSVGPATDILSAIIHTPPADCLSILEIPVNSVASSTFIPALAYCSGVQDILLYSPIGDDHLPPLELLPPDVLPNLRSYRGPKTYIHHFTHDRNVTQVELTLPCRYSPELCATLKELNIGLESLSYKVDFLDADVLRTIHATFPSLKRLVISGFNVDIDTLASVLTAAEVHRGLTSIQLDISTGEPRLTNSWRTTISKMFLTYLIRAYPSLLNAKLAYQPQAAVVWGRPPGANERGPVVVDASDLYVKKDEGLKTNAIWDTVKYKQV